MSEFQRIIEDITRFIFVSDPIEKADIIFVPGSSKHEPSERASQLYHEGVAKIILPSGKHSSKLLQFLNEKISQERYLGTYQSDWAFCRKGLTENGVPNVSILREDQSTNTYEYAFFSKDVTD